MSKGFARQLLYWHPYRNTRMIHGANGLDNGYSVACSGAVNPTAEDWHMVFAIEIPPSVTSLELQQMTKLNAVIGGSTTYLSSAIGVVFRVTENKFPMQCCLMVLHPTKLQQPVPLQPLGL
jgi:hypothetical protein